MVAQQSPREVVIGPHTIGTAHKPFVIAEMSGNHNGDIGRALSIVDAVADSGAHALKLQTYRPDTITVEADGPAFRVSDGHGLWGGRNLYQLYDEAHTPWEWHRPIFDRARERGLVPFSSPFDPTAVDLLQELGAEAYKIASLEVVDLPLIRLVAALGKPVIISTGAATLAEVDAAVRTCRDAGNDRVVVLVCTSSYPASPAESNLRQIPVLADALDVVVGLSDHTSGVGVAVAAVALGASMIEKHVTLARTDGGVDSDFSLEPGELQQLVDETERGWQGLGVARVGPTASESESLRLRRSLYVIADVKAGDPVSHDNVRSIRPAGGLLPAEMANVLHRAFTRDVSRGTPLTWEIV